MDSSGNAYVTGETASAGFPGTSGSPIQSGLALPTCDLIPTDAFVTKINTAGSDIVYSTYLGGGCVDAGRGIAVDSSGNAYVTGKTDSGTFPGTLGSLIQPCFEGLCAFNNNANFVIHPSDAFVTKINAAGSDIVYSTYLGGSGSDFGGGIAVDGSGNAYVTGQTASTSFPGTSGSPIQSGLALPACVLIATDAFVTKINAAGSAIVYSTYLWGVAAVIRVIALPWILPAMPM